MDDPDFVTQQLQLLLTAYGYNLYNQANRARADDLLVRQRASGSLGDAANHLSRLATEHAAQHVSTREQPFPTPEAMARLRQLQSLRDQVSVLAAKIRGMSAPTQDRTWARFRDEAETLRQLLYFDYRLLTETDAVYQAVAAQSVATWTDAHAAEIQALLAPVEQTARDRERFLQVAL